MKKTVAFYPPIHDQNDQSDLLGRLTWHLWPWRAQIETIKLWSHALPDEMDARARGLDPAIDAQYLDIRALVETAPLCGDEEAKAALIAAPPALVFVWRAPRTSVERAAVTALREAVEDRGGLVYVVDRNATQYEGSYLLWGCYNTFGDEAAFVGDCRAKFEALKRSVKRDRVYVFGTGPSLDLVPQCDLSDGDAIVCNSAVANEDLLDRLNPIAIVAGDPIFHAGCSQYASEFRAKLREALEKRDTFFVTVMRDYRQYLAQLPAHLHERVIALPFAEDKKRFRYKLDEEFRISPESNVLMLLLLPLAAALYDHISVGGCDGRPASENQYFWNHHKSSQFSEDKMRNIKETHPAFFVRSYDDHYASHVADIQRVVDALENDGKRVDTITPSYIPALAQRLVWSARAFSSSAQKPALLVSVNPDASDEHDEQLNYNRRMAEEAQRRGVAFIALGSNTLDDASLAGAPFLRRAFKQGTATAGDRWEQEISLPRLAGFEQTLREHVAAICAERPDHDRVYYLHAGGPPHALAMYRIARDNPDDSFVVNAAWTPATQREGADYWAQWGEFLRRAQTTPNLRIHAATPQLRVIAAKHAGVHLPLMSHPSPSMERPYDGAAPESDAPFTVLFPGGETDEEGARDILQILSAIRRNPALETARLIVRAPHATDGARNPSAREIETLAETADSAMDSQAFLSWLASADVAVLPHQKKQWRHHNPALAIDLLYLGVPLVCCKGTSLADLVDRYGGGLAVDEDDAEPYATAINAVRADLPRFKEAARRAARRYHASNSWPQLIDSVLAPATAPRPAPASADAEADRYAPIHWWPGAAPLTAAPADEPPAKSETPRPAPAAPEAPRPSLQRRFASFVLFQLTRSRRVQALILAGAALIIAALSELAPLEPIRTHLGVLALAAFAAAGFAIAVRFLREHAGAVHARMAARSESLADIAASASQALAAKGLAKKLAIGLVGIGAVTWLTTYSLRLASIAPQSALDLAFWLGGGLSALGACSVLALQTALHAIRRIASRWRMGRKSEDEAQARALAAQISAAMDDTVRRERAIEITNLRLSREIGAMRSSVTRSTRALEAKLAEAAIASEALQTKLQQIETHETALDGKLEALAAALRADSEKLEAIAAEQIKLKKRIALLQTAGKIGDEKLESITTAQTKIAKRIALLLKTDTERKEMLETMAASQTKIEKRAARIMTSTGSLGERLEAVSAAVEQAAKGAKASSALGGRIDKLQDEVRAVASSGYHGVERYLPKSELEHLASVLAKSFNIAISGRTLGYMSHQIRRLEADGEGRIAASMSDMLVRAAVLLAVDRKQAAVLEIGTLFGLGAGAMWAVARPQFDRVTLTLIDPLDGYYGRDFVPNQEDIVTGVPVTRETLEHNLRKAGVPDADVVIIQDLSQSSEALTEAAKHKYDVLIIDGDHSYEGAQRDFINYAPMVRHGGFIIFDDYGGKAWQGVTDFVDDLMAETPHLEKVLLHSRTLVCRVIEPVPRAVPKPDEAQAAANGQADAQAAAEAAPSRA